MFDVNGALTCTHPWRSRKWLPISDVNKISILLVIKKNLKKNFPKKSVLSREKMLTSGN